MTDELLSQKPRLSLRTKLSFASGSLEDAMVLAASSVTMVYYNQVHGVSGSLCGLAFLIGTGVDAISDPLVGIFSDNLRTRWGRRHPLMFISSFPLGIFFYLLYQPPSGFSENQLFLWLTMMSIGVHLAKSFYSVPHTALGAEFTDDYEDRTSLFGWNWTVYYLGLTILTFLIMKVVFPSTEGFENGLLNEPRYKILAIVGGLFISGMVLVCTFTTAHRIPYLRKLEVLSPDSKRPLSESFVENWHNFRTLIRNRSFFSVCVCWIILYVSGGILAVVTTYTLLYVFEWSTEEIGYRAFVNLPGVFLALMLSAWLVKKIDKRNTVLLTSFIAATLVGLPYCLKIIGWMPENNSPWLLPVMFGIWILGYTFLPLVPIVIDSQLGDIADEHELNTGNRSEGLIYSARTFGMKMARALGQFLAGVGLDLIHFPKNATAEDLTPKMEAGLLWMTGPLYIFIVYVGLGFTLLYNIDRKRHDEIKAKLKRRRADAAELES